MLSFPIRFHFTFTFIATAKLYNATRSVTLLPPGNAFHC